MSNLDKAKARIVASNKADKVRKKKLDDELRHKNRIMKEATRVIRADMKSYHNVETPNGKLTWHPRLLELRLDGKTEMFIKVSWKINVCTWYDNDFGGCYEDLVSLYASKTKYGGEPFVKSHYTNSFLEGVADHMSKLL